MSKAYDLFKNTLTRSENMMAFSWALTRTQENLDNDAKVSSKTYNKNPGITDIGRASIVTAVAAFDFYFTNRFSECVIPIIKKNKQKEGLINVLEKAGLDVSVSLELLSLKDPYEKIRQLIENHYDNYVTQRFDSIDNLYVNIGIKNLSEHIDNKSHKKDFLKSIKELIKRRHKIVHNGDLDKSGKLSELKPHETTKRIENLGYFVEDAEIIIYERMKKI